MSAHRRGFDDIKYMSFLVRYDELLENYNETWKKNKNSIKKEFDCEPVYNEQYVKTKVNSYNGKINTNFHNNKIPKKSSKFICLSVILINSLFKTDKNYYLQLFLKECKYVVQEKKKSEYITDDIEISSVSDK